jgi:hypothetical protein
VHAVQGPTVARYCEFAQFCPGQPDSLHDNDRNAHCLRRRSTALVAPVSASPGTSRVFRPSVRGLGAAGEPGSPDKIRERASQVPRSTLDCGGVPLYHFACQASAHLHSTAYSSPEGPRLSPSLSLCSSLFTPPGLLIRHLNTTANSGRCYYLGTLRGTGTGGLDHFIPIISHHYQPAICRAKEPRAHGSEYHLSHTR